MEAAGMPATSSEARRLQADGPSGDDIGFAGGFGKLVAEIGVGNGNEELGALPGALALEVHHAVFRDNVRNVRGGYGNHVPEFQRGYDIGYQSAVPVLAGGVQADKRLPSRRHISPAGEFQLAAGAADGACSYRLRTNLPAQVYSGRC